MDHNRALWRDWRLAWVSGRASSLFPAEIALIAMLRAERNDWRVLDIGVGSGRTSPHFAALGPTYIGVDYSPQMVRVAKKRFPQFDFRNMDATDLSAFADGQFDLVWFSYNGMDYGGPAERLRILAEVHRVIAPGGAFCFSAHNRDYVDLERITAVQRPALTPNPLRMAVRGLRYVQAATNSRQLKPLEERNAEYFILNDNASQHRFITYYTDVPQQVAQLERAGFTGVRAFGKDGEELDPASSYTGDYMVHFLARR